MAIFSNVLLREYPVPPAGAALCVRAYRVIGAPNTCSTGFLVALATGLGKRRYTAYRHSFSGTQRYICTAQPGKPGETTGPLPRCNHFRGTCYYFECSGMRLTTRLHTKRFLYPFIIGVCMGVYMCVYMYVCMHVYTMIFVPCATTTVSRTSI